MVGILGAAATAIAGEFKAPAGTAPNTAQAAVQGTPMPGATK